jgi:hypothetical protein
MASVGEDGRIMKSLAKAWLLVDVILFVVEVVVD